MAKFRMFGRDACINVDLIQRIDLHENGDQAAITIVMTQGDNYVLKFGNLSYKEARSTYENFLGILFKK